LKEWTGSTLELELAELDAKIEDQVLLCQQLFSSTKEAERSWMPLGDSKIADLEEQRKQHYWKSAKAVSATFE